MRTIFVWTLSDLITVVFLGLLALLGLLCGVLTLWEKVKKKFKRKA